MTTKTKLTIGVLAGLCAGLAIMAAVNSLFISTSTNDSCMSCHVHEDADKEYGLGDVSQETLDSFVRKLK